ncbi:MAG: hypothetical protein O7E52_07510 [Candidatus Poribacteria bacterium]|nr:hypothetical protein [Candidatus Poribacteria bacterium]
MKEGIYKTLIFSMFGVGGLLIVVSIYYLIFMGRQREDISVSEPSPQPILTPRSDRVQPFPQQKTIEKEAIVSEVPMPASEQMEEVVEETEEIALTPSQQERVRYLEKEIVRYVVQYGGLKTFLRDKGGPEAIRNGDIYAKGMEESKQKVQEFVAEYERLVPDATSPDTKVGEMLQRTGILLDEDP